MPKNSEPGSGDELPKISLDALNNLLRNPKTSEKDLAKYLAIDEEQSGPFSIVYRPNPDTVDIPQFFAPDPAWIEVREALSKFIDSIRNAIFEKTISGSYTGPIIVSEGDSWFVSVDTGITHQLILVDNLAIFCLESMGDTLENMAKQAEYIEAIREKNASILLFSGGGNEIVAGGNIKEYLLDFDRRLSASQHLLPKFGELLDYAMTLYSQILRSVEALSPDVLFICHGYDYVTPNSDKWPSWLGQPMNERGITDRSFQAAIARTMIDQFNERLGLLVDKFANARYLDLRGTVGPSRWFDEIHPTKAAFADIAAIFKAEIDRSARSR